MFHRCVRVVDQRFRIHCDTEERPEYQSRDRRDSFRQCKLVGQNRMVNTTPAERKKDCRVTNGTRRISTALSTLRNDEGQEYWPRIAFVSERGILAIWSLAVSHGLLPVPRVILAGLLWRMLAYAREMMQQKDQNWRIHNLYTMGKGGFSWRELNRLSLPCFSSTCISFFGVFDNIEKKPRQGTFDHFTAVHDHV